MKKPLLIWVVAFFCSLLVIAALAWQTVRLLSLEKSQALAEASADVEEHSRLALSRIDSAAASLLITENRRSISEFRSFSENGSASPLLTEKLEFIHLHFEMNREKTVSSPQVVLNSEKSLALAVGAGEGSLEKASQRLEVLHKMLIEPAGGMNRYTDQFSNIEDSTAEDKVVWSAPQKSVVKQKMENFKGATASYKNTKGYQTDRNFIEKEKRAGVVSKALSKGVKDVESKYNQSQLAFNNEVALSKKLLPRRGEEEGGGSDGVEPHFENSISDGLRSGLRSGLDTLDSVYPMQPIWVNDELLLVRKVTLHHETRYQGGWVRAQELRDYFESLVQDLLPNARLEAVNISGQDVADDDAMSLVSLPFRLAPNVNIQTEVPLWSPMRSSLAMSWLAALISMVAVAFLIKSILRLSERRASFVSAVTHELRTPLTTFRLYSEMLADGMVQDEGKKKQYLVTMKDEADRLSHLVENVLSYSKIERGSAKVTQETLSIGAIMDRVKGRLHDRVVLEGGRFDLENNCEEVELCTDVTAVEQILFNLVDNACKYGLPDEGEGPVLLTVDRVGRKQIVIRVQDQGRGINPRERKRLFKAFHKSAFDAANDKPGVGLGLSLCQRTAIQLGGSLTLEKSKGRGAVFALKLPLRRSL